MDKLIEALAAAKLGFHPVAMSGKNPHFKSKYATLSDLNLATKDALNNNGLVIIHLPAFMDGRVIMTTQLCHKSGQFVATTLSMKPANDTPQAVGSTISYAKRYNKAAILDIEGEEDDDGEAAEGRGKGNEIKQFVATTLSMKHKEPTKMIFNKESLEWAAWLKKNLKENQLADLSWYLDNLDGKPVNELVNLMEKRSQEMPF